MSEKIRRKVGYSKQIQAFVFHRSDKTNNSCVISNFRKKRRERTQSLTAIRCQLRKKRYKDESITSVIRNFFRLTDEHHS
jgi:hypothetical protein